MNYKIVSHFMPYELDYALLMFTQLKKSKYHLIGNDKIKIDVTLNLSDYLIDWNKSQLPKEFFKAKFKSLAPLLKDYILEDKIYEGTEVFGHLDTTRNAVENETDYYIHICPDMYFSEHLLNIVIEGSKLIKNDYFVLTPEIYKLWDGTWDEITHKDYLNVPYQDWNKVDVFDIRNNMKNINESVSLRQTQKSKWAGWFDLYNKNAWENLFPVLPEWHGYGPHDYYAMIVSEYAKNLGMDFQQWVVTNQIIFEYSVGPLKEGFGKTYKDFLSIKDVPNQRQLFEAKLPEFWRNWIDKNRK